jgi:hypothetical protein
MVTPINGGAGHAHETVSSQRPVPKAQAQKSTPLPSDTVDLISKENAGRGANNSSQ